MAYIDTTIVQAWDLVMESFGETMGKSSAELWFGKLVIESFDFESKTLILTTDSEMKYDVVQKNYIIPIQKKFSEILNFDIKVNLKFIGIPIDANTYVPEEKPVDPEKVRERHVIGSTRAPFNFEYTFENFIVGNSNKFAHAACVAVSEHPAMDYNPLFIYGPSGIGKTHLLYAITNALKAKNQNINVIYIKGDDFTNQMIDSLSHQSMKEFRDKYRKCDVLLIDDIQFIAGKIATQEEFFHTFNALVDEERQIILTSDRPPREIKTLEERLRTRFEWGLIADIQPPDLELRTAIIKKKAEQAGIYLQDDALYLLADNLKSNVRQIEGAVRKISARHFISNEAITISLIKQCITELLGESEPVTTTLDRIFAAVTSKYGISKADLISEKRNKEIVNARHVTVYLIKTITDMSLPNIGKIFGRDHSTVISSLNSVKDRMNSVDSFRAEIEDLIQKINEKLPV